MFLRPKHYSDAAFLAYIVFASLGTTVLNGLLPSTADVETASLILDFVVLFMAAGCVALGIALWRYTESAFGFGIALGFLTAFGMEAASIGLIGTGEAATRVLRVPVNIPACIAAATTLIVPGRSVFRITIPVCISVGALAWLLGWLTSTELNQMNHLLAQGATLLLLIVPLGVLGYIYFRRPSGILGGVLVFAVFSFLSWPVSPLIQTQVFNRLINLLGYLAVPFGMIVDGFAAMRQARVTPDRTEEDASRRDALTQLYNRRVLDTVGETMFREALEFGRPVSLLMMDLDKFKMVNDLYGHAAGDAVLRHFAGILGARMRATDMVARYGGEEFVAVLPGAPLTAAMRLAERIRRDTEAASFMHEGTRLAVTTSVGVACAFPEDKMTFAELVSVADQNLYRAKRSGRNIVMANPVFDTQDDS